MDDGQVFGLVLSGIGVLIGGWAWFTAWNAVKETGVDS